MMYRFLASLAAISSGSGAAAADYQNLDAVDARIAAVVAGAGTPVAVDRRIKLARCPYEPELSRVADGAIAVRCPALGWKIQVLVAGASTQSGPAEIVVHRGDPMELVARGPGYSATSLGTALDPGSAGGTIRVKIPTSPLPVSAIVVRAGVAAVSD